MSLTLTMTFLAKPNAFDPPAIPRHQRTPQALCQHSRESVPGPLPLARPHGALSPGPQAAGPLKCLPGMVPGPGSQDEAVISPGRASALFCCGRKMQGGRRFNQAPHQGGQACRSQGPWTGAGRKAWWFISRKAAPTTHSTEPSPATRPSLPAGPGRCTDPGASRGLGPPLKLD